MNAADPTAAPAPFQVVDKDYHPVGSVRLKLAVHRLVVANGILSFTCRELHVAVQKYRL